MPHASAAHVAWRLARSIAIVAYFALGERRRGRRRGGGTALDRGILLRKLLERLGGMFVKLGQQLSTRLDLLPFETCQELSKMLDAMPPFPTARAIETVERTTGRPLAETFAAFDPEPLGSASVACVYHAILRTGEEVAVKVRRPGIGTLFAADMAALDLVCRVAEWATLVRPGTTRAVRAELRTMLTEELDFRSEARYQDIFRRRAARDGQNISAPRVHHQHSAADVLVSEYVRGVWLRDLIEAKERGDARALQYCAGLGIDPETVAKRLLGALYWANFENLFYHADPHPANILVRPGNELVFIDFGACGPTTHRNRRNYAELFRRQANRDTAGMVQVFGSIVSPLPPLDTHALYKEGEALTARWQYGFESAHAEWWERTSAGMWIGMLELTRKFSIPVNIDTVRLVRSSLLYDTIAARLCDTIHMQEEFARYERALRRRAIQRARREPRLGAGRLARRAAALRVLAGDWEYRLAELADRPTTSFFPSLGRAPDVAATVLRLGAGIAAVTAASVALAWHGGAHDVTRAVASGASTPWYWAAVSLLVLRTYRMARFRLADPG